MTMEQLGARERHTLDHLRQAEELGVSLEYYASAYNLEVKDLSSVRQPRSQLDLPAGMRVPQHMGAKKRRRDSGTTGMLMQDMAHGARARQPPVWGSHRHEQMARAGVLWPFLTQVTLQCACDCWQQGQQELHARLGTHNVDRSSAPVDVFELQAHH